MSRSVDERVVDMQFQNQQFESGIKTSIDSIDKLKKSLNFDGAGKGLSDLSETTKKFSLAGIAEGVDTIASKFSALGVIAITALTNITNKAIDAGLKIAKSLTIEPIAGGYADYERKLTSVQTIMNATGKSIGEVESYFNVLDTYADKTIYNLDDMTSAFAKFTNAGVDLDKSVPAIKGISNMVALAGQNAGSAQIAYYNLAQSIAGGFLTTLDYKSLNLANVATKEWKEQMAEGAIAAGTLKKSADGMYHIEGAKEAFTLQSLFTDGLKEQWATTEVLLDVFGKYGDETTEIGAKAQKAAQDVKNFSMMMDTLKESVGTTWTDTFQIVIGDLEESKILFTGLSDAISGMLEQSANARNEMLQGWKDEGGRDAIINSFKNMFAAIMAIAAPIKEAFSDIFPPMTGERLANLSKALEEFTAKLKIGDETSDKLKRTFAGLFAALDLVGKGISFVFKIGGSLFELFGGPAASNILDVTARFGDFLVKLNEAAEQGNVFNKAFDQIKNVLTIVADKIKDAIDRIKNAFTGFKTIDTSALTEFATRSENELKPITRIGEIIGKVFEAMVKVFEWAAPILVKLGSIAGEAVGKLADVISDSVKNLEFDNILDLINGGLFAALLLGLKNFIKSLTGITDGAGGFLEGITGILDGVRGSLEAWQTNLQANTLKTIAIAIGILSASLLVLSLIDSEKLTDSLAAITVLFAELAITMTVLTKTLGNVKIAGISAQMIAMSLAILILAAAMQKMADLDWEGVAKGVVGVGSMSAILVVSANALSKSSGHLIKGSTGLIVFAAAIVVLTQAVKQLGDLDTDELVKGLVGVGVLVAELAIFMKVIETTSSGIGKSIGLIALAAAIKIFASAVEDLGSLDIASIVKGLTAMGVILAEIAIFMKFTGDAKNIIATATAMTILGAAMLIFAEAIGRMGDLSWEEIAKGLLTMAGALTAVTLAMKLLPTDMVVKSIALIAVATALTMMVAPLKEMGGMSWEEIAKGLITLAGAMAILVIGLNAMQHALPGAAAMVVVSAALAILAPVLKSLGEMSLAEIGKGILALAATFTVIGVAGMLLQPLVPTLIGLGVAVGLLGAGLALAGAGVLAFSAGLAGLAVGATAAAGAIVVIGAAVLSLIPLFFEKIGEGIVALGEVFINGAPILGKALVVLVEESMKALNETIPTIVNTVFDLLMAILTALDEKLPLVTEKLFSVVIGFLDEVAANMPALIKSGSDLLATFFKGVFDAIGGYNPENLLGLVTCIGILIAAFAVLAASKKLAKDAIIAMGAMAVVMGLIAALFFVISSLEIESTLEIAISLSVVLLAISAAMVILGLVPIPAALTAVASLAIFIGGIAAIFVALGALRQIPGFDWLMSEGMQVLADLGTGIGTFVGNIAGGFLTGVSASFPKIGQNLSDFMTNITPFIEGAKNIDSSAMEGILMLAATMLVLTAASLLDGLTSWIGGGGSSMVEFGKQIAEFAPYFAQYYETIKGVDGAVVEASANAALALAEFAANIPNQGGLLAKITGENSITAFAEELVIFGPKLLAYSNSIKGLDAAAVEASANAALTLAEFAANIPNQGGWLGKIVGENSITAFAEELVEFGPKLMAYSKSVVGLDAEVVVNSVNAALALAGMAENLPNQGGAASWFAGDNTLSVWAEELVIFGPKLMAYANSIKGMDSNVVINSANAAKALSELANNLPNQGGVASWFAGDNTIGTFGEELARFGEKFAKYYSFIKDINATQLANVLTQVKSLIAMAKDVTSANLSGLKTFGDDLTTMGNIGVTNFIKAFDDSYSKITTSITNMVKKITDTIKTEQPKVVEQMTKLMTESIQVITTKTPEMTKAVDEMMTKISESIKSKAEQAKQSIKNMMAEMVNAINQEKQGFERAGADCVEGFARGIDNNRSRAIEAAARVARDALRAAKDELDSDSPSKEFEHLGEDSDQGLANGLIKFAYLAENAAAEVGQASLTGLSDALSNIGDVIDSDMDMTPTITPVIDLTDVEAGSKSIDSLLNKQKTINVGNIKANAVAAGVNAPGSTTGTNGATDSETSIQFIQNNYSPKSLSRLDIYRTTKNLISTSKGLVTAQ